MKLFPIILTLLIFVCNFAFAQNENILLRPENGKEYFYRFTDAQYIADEEGKKFSEFRKQKTLHIKFSNVQPENKELLQVKVIQNKAEKPLDKPVQVTDYMYPYFESTYFGKRYDDYYEELLCDLEFQYEFDYETSEVKLYNRTDVLLEVRKRLKHKQFDEKGIESYTTEFNEKGIPEITNRLNSIYRISQDFQAEINNGERFKSTVSVKDKFANISAKAWDREPGLNALNIIYNIKESYLKNYNWVEIDSGKQNGWSRRNPEARYYREQDICLLRQKIISENRFTVSGKIENPKYKKVTLAVLQNPYGTELHQESVFLDENNTFHIETELNHRGIVMLQFGHTNQSRELPILLIYAEPGGRIELNDSGETFLENLEFTGDFCNASKMLYEFRKKYNLDDKYTLETTFWRTISSNMVYTDFEGAVKNYDAFAATCKNEIDETAFEFINKEMKAYLSAGTMYYLDGYSRTLNAKFKNYYFKDVENVDVQLFQSFFDNNSVSELYNEFGIFSRFFAREYLSYQIGNTVKSQKLFRTGFDRYVTLTSYYWLRYDFSLSLELGRVILNGHAYYSSVADVIQQLKRKAKNEVTQNDEIVEKEIDEYADLLMRLCNNKEFTQGLKELYANHKNWEKQDFVPSDKFFNTKGEEVYLKDFMGEKPTVFYVANNWGAERYYFDDLSKENPDINFVMIMEGNIFQEWQDYMKRAEPVAHQLLLINTDKGLKDIFRKGTHHFIIYDKNGVRFAFAGNMASAKDLAKQSLFPKKKELNKSQLQIVIWVLLIVLTTLIIGLIIWKWRVRRQFRKEEQKRRLRELELTAIRSQMNPHFLFNSLNSVQNLVQQNKGREAHLYLSDFAGLIRKVLNNSEKEEVSLAEELEMIQQYLNLEKLRFDFEFDICVDEKIDTHNTLVPSMLLQPFAENAVIHGLQNKEGKRQLKLRVTKETTRLAVPNRLAHNTGGIIKITIEDNGIGREAAKEIAKQKNGKGTKLMKERLEILQQKQGERYSLTTVDLEEGTRVEIVLPEES